MMSAGAGKPNNNNNNTDNNNNIAGKKTLAVGVKRNLNTDNKKK